MVVPRAKAVVACTGSGGGNMHTRWWPVVTDRASPLDDVTNLKPVEWDRIVKDRIVEPIYRA
jgi:hypothetical protein